MSVRKALFGVTKCCVTLSLSWANQRPTTSPSLSHHFFTLSTSKSRNVSSAILTVLTRLGGTLLLLETLACVRGIRRRFVSEVACLNGKHCVDTFVDLEKFCDSIDNVKLIQQGFPAQMESCRVIHVSFGAHGTACAENWRPVVRMDITVQFHPPRLPLFEFLGQSFAVQVVARRALPLPCSDWPAGRRHQPPSSRHLLSSASLVGCGNMHAGQGSDRGRFNAFPAQVDDRSIKPSVVTRGSARAAGARVVF